MNISDFWEKMFGWIPQKLIVYKSEEQWFWSRELFHFLGGVTISIPGMFFVSVVPTLISGVIMTGLIIWKEIREDKVSQTRFKTIIDVSSWVVGFLFLTILKRLHV